MFSQIQELCDSLDSKSAESSALLERVTQAHEKESDAGELIDLWVDLAIATKVYDYVGHDVCIGARLQPSLPTLVRDYRHVCKQAVRVNAIPSSQTVDSLISELASLPLTNVMQPNPGDALQGETIWTHQGEDLALRVERAVREYYLALFYAPATAASLKAQINMARLALGTVGNLDKVDSQCVISGRAVQPKKKKESLWKRFINKFRKQSAASGKFDGKRKDSPEKEEEEDDIRNNHKRNKVINLDSDEEESNVIDLDSSSEEEEEWKVSAVSQSNNNSNFLTQQQLLDIASNSDSKQLTETEQSINSLFEEEPKQKKPKKKAPAKRLFTPDLLAIEEQTQKTTSNLPPRMFDPLDTEHLQWLGYYSDEDIREPTITQTRDGSTAGAVRAWWGGMFAQLEYDANAFFQPEVQRADLEGKPVQGASSRQPTQVLSVKFREPRIFVLMNALEQELQWSSNQMNEFKQKGNVTKPQQKQYEGILFLLRSLPALVQFQYVLQDANSQQLAGILHTQIRKMRRVISSVKNEETRAALLALEYGSETMEEELYHELLEMLKAAWFLDYWNSEIPKLVAIMKDSLQKMRVAIELKSKEKTHKDTEEETELYKAVEAARKQYRALRLYLAKTLWRDGDAVNDIDEDGIAKLRKEAQFEPNLPQIVLEDLYHLSGLDSKAKTEEEEKKKEEGPLPVDVFIFSYPYYQLGYPLVQFWLPEQAVFFKEGMLNYLSQATDLVKTLPKVSDTDEKQLYEETCVRWDDLNRRLGYLQESCRRLELTAGDYLSKETEDEELADLYTNLRREIKLMEFIRTALGPKIHSSREAVDEEGADSEQFLDEWLFVIATADACYCRVGLGLLPKLQRRLFAVDEERSRQKKKDKSLARNYDRLLLRSLAGAVEEEYAKREEKREERRQRKSENGDEEQSSSDESINDFELEVRATKQLLKAEKVFTRDEVVLFIRDLINQSTIAFPHFQQQKVDNKRVQDRYDYWIRLLSSNTELKPVLDAVVQNKVLHENVYYGWQELVEQSNSMVLDLIEKTLEIDPSLDSHGFEEIKETLTPEQKEANDQLLLKERLMRIIELFGKWKENVFAYRPVMQRFLPIAKVQKVSALQQFITSEDAPVNYLSSVPKSKRSRKKWLKVVSAVSDFKTVGQRVSGSRTVKDEKQRRTQTTRNNLRREVIQTVNAYRRLSEFLGLPVFKPDAKDSKFSNNNYYSNPIIKAIKLSREDGTVPMFTDKIWFETIMNFGDRINNLLIENDNLEYSIEAFSLHVSKWHTLTADIRRWVAGAAEELKYVETQLVKEIKVKRDEMDEETEDEDATTAKKQQTKKQFRVGHINTATAKVEEMRTLFDRFRLVYERIDSRITKYQQYLHNNQYDGIQWKDVYELLIGGTAQEEEELNEAISIAKRKKKTKSGDSATTGNDAEIESEAEENANNVIELNDVEEGMFDEVEMPVDTFAADDEVQFLGGTIVQPLQSVVVKPEPVREDLPPNINALSNEQLMNQIRTEVIREREKEDVDMVPHLEHNPDDAMQDATSGKVRQSYTGGKLDPNVDYGDYQPVVQFLMLLDEKTRESSPIADALLAVKEERPTKSRALLADPADIPSLRKMLSKTAWSGWTDGAPIFQLYTKPGLQAQVDQRSAIRTQIADLLMPFDDNLRTASYVRSGDRRGALTRKESHLLSLVIKTALKALADDMEKPYPYDVSAFGMPKLGEKTLAAMLNEEAAWKAEVKEDQKDIPYKLQLVRDMNPNVKTKVPTEVGISKIASYLLTSDKVLVSEENPRPSHSAVVLRQKLANMRKIAPAKIQGQMHTGSFFTDQVYKNFEITDISDYQYCDVLYSGIFDNLNRTATGRNILRKLVLDDTLRRQLNLYPTREKLLSNRNNVSDEVFTRLLAAKESDKFWKRRIMECLYDWGQILEEASRDNPTDLEPHMRTLEMVYDATITRVYAKRELDPYRPDMDAYTAPERRLLFSWTQYKDSFGFAEQYIRSLPQSEQAKYTKQMRQYVNYERQARYYHARSAHEKLYLGQTEEYTRAFDSWRLMQKLLEREVENFIQPLADKFMKKTKLKQQESKETEDVTMT